MYDGAIPAEVAASAAPIGDSWRSAIAIRGGFWQDPDHRIRYTGTFSPDTILFPEGDSEQHFTFGGGVVFEKVQFDLGFDRSETVKTFSVSAVLRF